MTQQRQSVLTKKLHNIYNATKEKGYELGEGIVKKITMEQTYKPMMIKESNSQLFMFNYNEFKRKTLDNQIN